jgi:CBS domain-containing protein
MQTVSEVMTRQVQVVSPDESLQRAAQLMDELNVGALPVVTGDRLVGMITDRDITIRGTAAGLAPQEAHIDQVMSAEVRWCFEDQPLDEVMIQMADSQIRRIPVVSHDNQQTLVGIVSLGDVATKTPADAKQDVQQVVELVSSPTAAGGGAAAPIEDIVGRTGSGTDGGTADMGGVGMTGAGESGLGAAGAAGAAGTSGGPAGGQGGGQGMDQQGDQAAPGTSEVPGKTAGVGGSDLSADGLPPA